MLTSLNDAMLISNHTKKSIIPDDWSSWSEGSIGMTKIDAKTNSSKIDIDTQSLAVGFDKKLNNNDLLGFAVQYGQSDTDVGSNGSAIDSKNYNLSVYRTRPLEEDNFIEGLIGIGFLENDITRKSDANTNTGSRKGNQLFGSVNYGKTIDKGDFNLTPTARVDLGYTELDAYTETGTNALSYDKQTVESSLASLGLAFDNIVKFENSSLKPFGSIEYGYDFSNSSDAKMNYVGSATNFTVKQLDTSDHLLSSEIGFEFIAKNNLNLTASYKRTEGDQDMSTDAIKFGLNFKSKQETEYAMTLDGSEDLAAGFNVVKNINGFDLSLNAKQAFNENVRTLQIGGLEIDNKILEQLFSQKHGFPSLGYINLGGNKKVSDLSPLLGLESLKQISLEQKVQGSSLDSLMRDGGIKELEENGVNIIFVNW